LEGLERAGEVGGDLGVILVAGEPIAGVDIRAADDDDVVGLVPLSDAPGPGGAAAGVAGSAARGQGDAAEGDFLAVLEHAGDRARLPATPGVEVLPFAPPGDHGVVAAHDVNLGAGQFPGEGVAGDVVGVGVTGQEDLDVAHLEAE